jgi:hypothetical protein
MITNQELEKAFECDGLACPSRNMQEKLKRAILEELPKILPLDELDEVQWDFVYGQIKIMVADDLQMKNKYLKDKTSM